MSRQSLPRRPKKLEPIPGLGVQEEQNIGMILALTSEVAVLRARLDAFERLLVAAGVLAPGVIDAFAPDPAAEAERERVRVGLITKVLRPVLEQAEEELDRIAKEADR